MITNSVSPSSHLLSAHPSVPQIRSRITVVCAECKRLKLKCDRRNPCGSCTKRDTVSRCIYSPAAAEKVDLHSLNNRLIQVEATLSLITSGQTPPTFQSSYPYSQVQSSNAATADAPANRSLTQPPMGAQHHHHHHHISVPSGSSNASISLSAQDLSSIWLDELDGTDLQPLNVTLPCPWISDVNSVKLEAFNGTEFTYPCPGAANEGPPTNPSSSQGGQPNNAHLCLPPLSAYYASASSACVPEAQHVPQSYPSTSHISAQLHRPDNPAPVGKPSVTPSLVALLPPLARTKQMLRNAASVIRERPVPLPACLLSSLSDAAGVTGTNSRNDPKLNKRGKGKPCLPSLATHWDALEFRAMCLVGSRGLGYGTSTKMTDRREREKVGVRAREIFFGCGVSSTPPIEDFLPSQQPGTQALARDVGGEHDVTERPIKERSESLPFFAIICLLLALGAAASKTAAREDVPVQFPIHDEKDSPEFFYALAQQSLSVWENNMMTSSVPSGDDRETSKAEEDEKLDYLIACLLAVGYQLFEPHPKPKGKVSEKRRINALNKVFSLVGKMVNMARVVGLGNDRTPSVRCKDEGLGTAKLNVKEPLSGKDSKKRAKVGDRRRRKDDLRRLIWWDIVFYELFISDALGHSSLLASSPCAVKLPRCPGPPPSDETESDREDGHQDFRDEELGFHEILERYHGARCRLAKIAQNVKQKLGQPDCCCGYTLDQAATLEAEVNCFLEGLPLPLRFLLSDKAEDTNASGLPRPNKGTDQWTKLKLQSCELAIIAQRLIIMAYLPFMSQSSTSASSAALDGEAQKGGDIAWIPALQPIVNAAQCIIQASKVVLQVKSSDWPSDYRITPSLLDLYPVEKALLDAVIICTHAGTFHGTLFAFHQAADDASSALEMLRGLDLDPESNVLLGRVKKRFRFTTHGTVPASLHGTKRKHDSIVLEGGGNKAEVSRRGAHASHLSAGPGSGAGHATRNDGPTDSAASRAPSIESTNSGRDPETGQKDKKHAKKNHPYPPVGIRVRQGKEVIPPFLRHRIDSPSISLPSPGGESETRTPQRVSEAQSSLAATPASDGIRLTPSSEYGSPQQQQSSQMDPGPPVMASLLDDPSYQRSSNSLNQDLHLHSQHEARQAYNPNLNDAYEQGQKLSPQETQMNLTARVDPFERNGDNAGMSAFNHLPQSPRTVQSRSYVTPGRLSSSDASPYLTNGGMAPPIGSFGQAGQPIVSHRTTPSTYGQELTTGADSNPYYHLSPDVNFNSVFDRSEEHPYIDIGLDAADGASTAIIGNRANNRLTNARGATPSAAYEKARPAIYDVKPPLDEIQMHHHVLQHQPFDVGQHHLHSQNHHSMTMESPTQGWAPQGTIGGDCSQNFWATPVEGFKYIH